MRLKIKLLAFTLKLHTLIGAEGSGCSLPRGTPLYSTDCQTCKDFYLFLVAFDQLDHAGVHSLLSTPLLLPCPFLSQETEMKEQSLVKVCTRVSGFQPLRAGVAVDAHSALKGLEPCLQQWAGPPATGRAPAPPLLQLLSCPAPSCSHL